MVFVDTGAWFALFVPSDPRHAEIRAWLSVNEEPLITSDYCVDETLTLLLARKRPRLALEAGRALFAEELAQLVYLSPAQIRSAWALFQVRSHAGWSFTDCTSLVLLADLKIRKAATLDEHFRQFGDVEVVP